MRSTVAATPDFYFYGAAKLMEIRACDHCEPIEEQSEFVKEPVDDGESLKSSSDVDARQADGGNDSERVDSDKGQLDNDNGQGDEGSSGRVGSGRDGSDVTAGDDSFQEVGDDTTVVTQVGELATTGAHESVDNIKEEFEYRYKIVRKIAVGGMGTILEAQHVVLGKRVALKVLNKALAGDHNAIVRFEREARACASLEHPNLVQVYDCGLTNDGIPYLVMDFVPGPNLLAILREQKQLEPRLFFDVFIAVSGGLAFAHSLGVIHRDLKPGNIILTPQPGETDIPKVVDFGIAKVEEMGGLLQLLTQTGQLLGSPNYMSPEQCRGEEVDGRTDIYALGCVMYEALTGKRAFRGHSPTSLIFQQMRKDPVAPDAFEAPDEFETTMSTLVMKCIEKEPEDRFQTMQELQEALTREKKNWFGEEPSARGLSLFSQKNAANMVTLAAVSILILTATIVFSVKLFGGKSSDTANGGVISSIFGGAGGMFGGGEKNASVEGPTAARLANAVFVEKQGLRDAAQREYVSLINKNDKSTSVLDQLTIALLLMKEYDDAEKWSNVEQTFRHVAPSLERLSAVAGTLSGSDGNASGNTSAKNPGATSNNSGGTSNNSNVGGSARDAAFVPLLYHYYARARSKAGAGYDAETQLMTGLKLAQSLNVPPWVRATLEKEYGIALFSNFKNRDVEALLHLQHGLKLWKQEKRAKRIRDSEIVDTCKWLFWTCQRLDKNDEAAEYLGEAIDLQLKLEHYNRATRNMRELVKHLADNKQWDKLAIWQKRLAVTEELKPIGDRDDVLSSEPLKTVSPLTLVCYAQNYKDDDMKRWEANLEAAWKRAEQEKAPDLDKLAIAQNLLSLYSPYWEDSEASDVLRRVAPSLNRVKEAFEKSSRQGALSFTGGAPLIYCHAAETKMHSQDFPGAVKSCEEGLKLAAGQPDGQLLRAKLERQMGQAYLGMGKLDEAERLLSKSGQTFIDLYGRESSQGGIALKDMASVYEKQKRYPRAVQTLKDAIAVLEKANSMYQAREAKKDLDRIEKLK